MVDGASSKLLLSLVSDLTGVHAPRGDAGRIQPLREAGRSHMTISVVSTGARSGETSFHEKQLNREEREKVSPLGPAASRSRRRALPYAIALLRGIVMRAAEAVGHRHGRHRPRALEFM